MNKRTKLFRGLSLLIKKPNLINLLLDSEYNWQNYLRKNKYPIQLPTIDLLNFLKIESKLSTYTFSGGGSLPTDIALLTSLAETIQDCSYFEIGTWRGESIINVAEYAKDCYTLNLSKEEIRSEGLPQEYANLHGELSKECHNISHLYGNSLFFDFESLNKKFDLIFIDGNHAYEYVKNDSSKVFEHLIHPSSIVVWHDYASNPEKVRPDVLAGILDGVPKEFHSKIYHVSNSLCAIYYPKEIESELLHFPVSTKILFDISLKARSRE